MQGFAPRIRVRTTVHRSANPGEGSAPRQRGANYRDRGTADQRAGVQPGDRTDESSVDVLLHQRRRVHVPDRDRRAEHDGAGEQPPGRRQRPSGSGTGQHQHREHHRTFRAESPAESARGRGQQTEAQHRHGHRNDSTPLRCAARPRRSGASCYHPCRRPRRSSRPTSAVARAPAAGRSAGTSVGRCSPRRRRRLGRWRRSRPGRRCRRGSCGRLRRGAGRSPRAGRSRRR